MVTSLENLSIYFMDESHRRHMEENAKRDRVENYESMNIDYVVEDYAFGCLIENIELLAQKTETDPDKVKALAGELVKEMTAITQPVATGEQPADDKA